MKYVFFLIVFGGALSVRLTRGYKTLSWVIWAFGVILGVYGPLFVGGANSEFPGVLLASVIGFCGPTKWQRLCEFFQAKTKKRGVSIN